ncbi:MAG TPA: glycosyltransferase family 87 protein [Vicinamibacterales bacterium]|nr:glycosyltransferase family 87 protein [Vicinamibacterales bacterium]
MTVFAPATRKGLAVLAVVALAATVAIAVHQHHRTELKLADPLGGHISDFDRWMIMAPHFIQDHADYVNDQLPTPPLSLIVFGPLTALSRPDAAFVWACLKLPIAGLVLFLCAAIVSRAGVQLTSSALVLILAGWWLAVVVDMQEGQTNFLALTPLVGGLYLAQRERWRSDLGAGALIGLGAAMKVTPVIFVVYFLWKRRWLVAAAAALSIAACLLVVPALVFGWDQNLRWLDQWSRIMIVPFVAKGAVVYSTTQSIPSMVLRLLTRAPAFDSHHGGVTVGHYMNVAAFGNGTARQIVRALMVGAGLAGLWWARRPLATLRSRRYVIEVGMVAAFMLWFSERTWVHHYVSFILTLAAAGMVLSDPSQPESARRPLRVALLVFAAVSFFASDAGKLFGPDGVDWAKAAGVYLWPSLLVAAALVRSAESSSHEAHEAAKKISLE